MAESDRDVEDLVATFLDRHQSNRIKQLLAHSLIRDYPDQAAELILGLAGLAKLPKARKKRTLHLRAPNGVAVCGRGMPDQSNLRDDLEEVTCLWCQRALHVPKSPLLVYVQSDFSERNTEIVRRVQDGETLEVIGESLGISRERVRQIVNAQGVEPGEIRQQIQAKTRQKKQAEYDVAHTRKCVVCRKVFIGAKNAVCCGHEDCMYVLRHGRRYVHPEYYDKSRRSQAQSILRYPEKHDLYQVEYARRVLDTTTAPKSRYVIPGSKIAQALQRVADRTGRSDLIPGVPHKKPEKFSFVCRATSLNGKPCTRPVAEEGGLCHIHAGATKHSF